MATSGDERSIQKIGAGVMDSETGGFTADEREQSAHILQPLSKDINDTIGFDDDEDEDDSENNSDENTNASSLSILSSNMSNLVRHSPQVVTPTPPTPPPPHSSPAKKPIVPKPRDFSSSKNVPSGRPVDPNRKRNKGKSVLRSVVASSQPQNDSESEAGRARVTSGEKIHGIPGSSKGMGNSYSHLRKQSVTMPSVPLNGMGNYDLPDKPLKAVQQYDRSMEFIIHIFRELSHHNMQATNVANMLIIFRDQMRPWCLKGEEADWADAAKYMSAFIGTMERVIQSYAETARITQQQRSALIPPTIPSSTPLQSPRRNGQSRGSSHQTPPPITPSSNETHHQVKSGESTTDEMSDVHYNHNPRRTSSVSQAQPHAPAGLHYNQSGTSAPKEMILPPYAVETSQEEREANGCHIS